MAIRWDRQLDIFDPANPALQIPIHIAGVGAGGSWLVLGLAKMGLKDITVYDPDIVEPHNVSNQAYETLQAFDAMSMQETKVRALRDIVEDQTGIQIRYNVSKFPQQAAIEPLLMQHYPIILVSAVDSMKSRKDIWEWVKLNPQKVALLIDPRMGGDTAIIYTIDPQSMLEREFYEGTLHDDELSFIKNEEAKKASQNNCRAGTIIDTVWIEVGCMIRTIRRFLVTGKHKQSLVIDTFNNITFSE